MQHQSEMNDHPVQVRRDLFLECISVVAFCCVQVIAWSKVTQSLSVSHWLVLAIVAGWLAADLLSGCVHFLADNFGTENTPILGRAFISPFREHHVRPKQILEHGFFERNGWNCGGAALLTIPVLIFDSKFNSHQGWQLFAIFTLTVSVFVSLTNQIHAWAHGAPAISFVQLLQRAGIFLSPGNHDHHHEPFNRATRLNSSYTPTRSTTSFLSGHYCITSGIWNRLFGAILRRKPS